MNWFSKTTLDLQDTKRIHIAWKSKVRNFIKSPLPWRKANRHKINANRPPEESLETLLSQKCGKIAFRDFLQSEFCEENLDFWLACEKFKSLESVEELKQRAAGIYEEFVRAEAPRQVNLDFHTSEIIFQGLQRPTPSCFVAAQRKIYSLMENDSFPRFILSQKHKVLLHSASKQRGLGEQREALRIKSTEELVQRHLRGVSLQRDLDHFHNR